MAFERKYAIKFSDNRDRDRFQVEFNEEERELFTNAQIYIQQCKDATAIKQWAKFGYLMFVNPKKAHQYLMQTYYNNNKKNERIGITKEFMEVEIESRRRDKPQLDKTTISN